MAPAVISSGDGPQQTPYSLDPEQTLRASKALLEHIRNETKRIQQTSSRKDLLKATDPESDADEDEGDETPVWLNLSTKQHVVDRTRLKPSKIAVPHSLNASPNLTICLITADPQRAVKKIVADASFPSALSSRINKIIGYTKLKARYKTFESRRQLLSEHDIFLADARIVTRLPDTLGKVFYKGTAKRPIPINIAARQEVKEKKPQPIRTGQKSKEEKLASFASPAEVANEITRAIDSVPVSLKPGTLVAARVGLASFTAEQLEQNVTAVAISVIEKHVVKGWRNVKAIHIKSPTSMAIPVWLADDLWAEAGNVVEKEDVTAIEAPADSRKRKRNPNHTKGPQVGQRKRAKADDETETLRKSKLAAQKASAFKADGITA